MEKTNNISGENTEIGNLTRGFNFVVYPSMVTFKENLSMIFSQSDLYGVKMSEKNFEMHISPIRGLLIALQSPAAQTFSNFFFNI